MKAITYILALIIGGLLFLNGVQFCTHRKDKKEIEKKDSIIVTRTIERDSCWHAPVRIDTVHDTIYVTNGKPYKPKPVSLPTTIIETVQKDSSCENWYNDVYHFQGGRLRWTAHVKGCTIEEIAFPEIVYPKETITITKTVDTCIAKPIQKIYTAKNHWGVYGGFTLKDVKAFPGGQIGLHWSIKDKWGLQGGALYLPENKTLYGQINILLYFK